PPETPARSNSRARTSCGWSGNYTPRLMPAYPLRLDPWAAEYEGAIQIPEGGDEPSVRVDVGVESQTWAAVRPDSAARPGRAACPRGRRGLPRRARDFPGLRPRARGGHRQAAAPPVSRCRPGRAPASAGGGRAHAPLPDRAGARAALLVVPADRRPAAGRFVPGRPGPPGDRSLARARGGSVARRHERPLPPEVRVRLGP